jgi:2-polyprenyl-3-methyl-5-hydroxy-6-metoxy-1,4-benzoquinol methylase
MNHTFETEFNEYQQTRQRFWAQQDDEPKRSLGGYYHRALQSIYGHLVTSQASILEIGCGGGDLLASLKPSQGLGIDFCQSIVDQAQRAHPTLEFICADAHELNLQGRTFDFIILSELVNDLWDVQTVLNQVKACCHPQTRIIFNVYSHLWNLPLQTARKLGLATPVLPQNWLTVHDMNNLLEISGFQMLRNSKEILFPFEVLLLTKFCNRYLAKIWPFRHLDLANFIIARPVLAEQKPEMTVSVVVAARNESGHIDELMARIPEMGAGTEIIFVEGNSTDDTYQAIERCIANNPHKNCRLLKQPGKGKGDAVRAGFAVATGDILMILDADITVPPEDLPRFYDLIANGEAEFVNGVRLVYPMDTDAMRFANLIGNKFFSWAFSWLLGQPIRDTLCGTKVLSRADYQRIADNRAYFGDFDPFGDFDLLFGAARLNLKFLEVPVRYRARRYGETNISRWKHGVLLLRMVVFAARRIKFI